MSCLTVRQAVKLSSADWSVFTCIYSYLLWFSGNKQVSTSLTDHLLGVRPGPPLWPSGHRVAQPVLCESMSLLYLKDFASFQWHCIHLQSEWKDFGELSSCAEALPQIQSVFKMAHQSWVKSNTLTNHLPLIRDSGGGGEKVYLLCLRLIFTKV